MTAADLRHAGRALLGHAYSSTKLATVLGVDPRTVRRWLSGEREIPEAIPGVMARLAAARVGELRSLAGVSRD